MKQTHLLVAVTADDDAIALVEHAQRMHAGLGGTWSVVGIDAALPSAAQSAAMATLLQALDWAERQGAMVSRISTGTHTPTGLVSSLVHRAASENATDLMIGRAPQGRGTGLSDNRVLGDFTDVLRQLLPNATVHLVCLPGRPSAAPSRAPDPRRIGPGRQDWYRVLLTLAVCTGACAALERYLHPANLVMVFLTGVVYVASRAGRMPAIVTVLGSIFIYDLIFVAPRWSLKPTEPQYWFAFLVMMIVGLIIGQLAARSREQAIVAEERAQRTEALHQLSVVLGRARDDSAVAVALCHAVRSSTANDAVVLAMRGDRLEPLDSGIDPWRWDQACARRSLEMGVETGVGTAIEPDQQLRYVPMLVGNERFGVLAIRPTSESRDTLEDRHLVRSLANQAAVAMERAAFERKSIAAAIDAEGERTRNTLLAGISHDFRTPLTTIVGNATSLLTQSRILDEAHRSALLRSLLGEAERLHLLTSNLLDLTRLDEGAIQLRPEWCPVDELLEQVMGQFRSRLGNLELQARAAPDALVWGDPRLIEQVLVNLIDNAIRHSPPAGRIEVSVQTDDRHWTLSVRDEGPGVPEGHEQAIFRKFYRAAGDGDSTGKGLGLAICAAVAKLHGGEIRAASDRGACFVMTLPQPEMPTLAQQGEFE